MMNTVSIVKTRTLAVAKVVGLLAFAAAAFLHLSFCFLLQTRPCVVYSK